VDAISEPNENELLTTPKMPIEKVENATTNAMLSKPFCISPFETSTFLIKILAFDERENRKVKNLPLFVIML
jgi:hypothetical protein